MSEEAPIIPEEQAHIEVNPDVQATLPEATPIEVAYHDGSNQEAGVSEQLADQVEEPVHLGTIDHGDESKRIDDVDKAWDMAKASNNQRTWAAAKRADARIKEETGVGSAWPEQFRASAEGNDKEAEELEDWAAVLHDHPISESYLAAHERMRLSPEDLASMELHVQMAKERIEVFEDALKHLPADAGINGATFESTGGYLSGGDLAPKYILESAYGRKDRPLTKEAQAKWEAWDALHKDPNTTLAQLRDAYADAFKIGVINPIYNRVGAAQGVLEDVRSGRASQ